MGIHYGQADFINYGKPSLFLDFANKKSLVDRISGNNLITFTRSSVGTYVDADGLIKTAAADEARFDHNPLTGEKFWNGWVVDNDLYYVQIRNGTDVHTDYWLYTGDVYGPELGEPTQPVVRTADPGKAPFTAEALEVGVNQGQLMPGEEQWYSFSRFDANAPGKNIDTMFTLVFTPEDGNRKYRHK